MRKYASVLVMMSLLMFLAAACRTPAGRSPERVYDDTAITSKIKAKLLQDSVMQGLSITVDTFQGQVTLIGAVNTPEQKQRAEEIARSTEGVTKVNNLLQIKR